MELLKDRIRLEGGKDDLPDISVGSKGLVQLCNDYSIVIQEYFHNNNNN
jgi:hypothetical protein